jgi:hypothetical protein
MSALGPTASSSHPVPRCPRERKAAFAIEKWRAPAARCALDFRSIRTECKRMSSLAGMPALRPPVIQNDRKLTGQWNVDCGSCLLARIFSWCCVRIRFVSPQLANSCEVGQCTSSDWEWRCYAALWPRHKRLQSEHTCLFKHNETELVAVAADQRPLP